MNNLFTKEEAERIYAVREKELEKSTLNDNKLLFINFLLNS
jgi:hypothetical protein